MTIEARWISTKENALEDVLFCFDSDRIANLAPQLIFPTSSRRNHWFLTYNSQDSHQSSAKCISNLIPISEIPIPICAAWDYWSIILCFRSPLFASGGPLLSIRPPLLLSPVALNTFVALWLSLAQTLIFLARACADLWPSGPRLRGPLLFRSVLAWIFAL